ncbi:MAG: sugar phosphate isomerase/epimerase [Oscillospiraceae bacterium]|nr:sugar phosphate isomerase/epimerase [Oscillospiraceae bacterium]
MKTGIQVSSFRPVLKNEAQVAYAIDRMGDMGCGTVQLQWIDPAVEPAFIAGELARRGIRSVSVQDYYTAVAENRDYYTELNRHTGGTWVCVSRIPGELRSEEGLREYVRRLRAMAADLEAMGQKLCFHPVSADFAPEGELEPVEALLDEMPELAICADLYHLHKTGRDMIAWLRRYAGRVCMVHFKDYAPDGALVPAGQGVIDWTGVVNACRDTGVEYAFVEQETWQGDPFQRLEEALNWLDGQ